MEKWSILSNVINYAQYNSNHIDYYKIGTKALEPKTHKKIYGMLEADEMPEKMKREYYLLQHFMKIMIWVQHI